jgi:hypothetical protein
MLEQSPGIVGGRRDELATSYQAASGLAEPIVHEQTHANAARL